MAKHSVRIVLICFVVAVLAVMVIKEARVSQAWSAQSTAEATVVPEEAEAVRHVVYYFHGNRRCTTCVAIQTQSERAVHALLAELIESGDLEWRQVNFETPGNEHYRNDFELAFQSLVLAEERAGTTVRYKNVAEVWTMIRTPEQVYAQFVMDTVLEFMAEGNAS